MQYYGIACKISNVREYAAQLSIKTRLRCLLMQLEKRRFGSRSNNIIYCIYVVRRGDNHIWL